MFLVMSFDALFGMPIGSTEEVVPMSRSIFNNDNNRSLSLKVCMEIKASVIDCAAFPVISTLCIIDRSLWEVYFHSLKNAIPFSNKDGSNYTNMHSLLPSGAQLSGLYIQQWGRLAGTNSTSPRSKGSEKSPVIR